MDSVKGSISLSADPSIGSEDPRQSGVIRRRGSAPPYLLAGATPHFSWGAVARRYKVPEMEAERTGGRWRHTGSMLRRPEGVRPADPMHCAAAAGSL